MCFLGGRSLPAPQIPAGQWHPRTPAPSSVRSELSGVRNCPREAVSPLLAGHLSARTSQGSRSPGLSSSLGGRWRLSWDLSLPQGPGVPASRAGGWGDAAMAPGAKECGWSRGQSSTLAGRKGPAGHGDGICSLQTWQSSFARLETQALGASFTLPQPPRCGVTGRVTGSRSEARGVAGLGFCPWALSPRSASVGSVLTATLRPHSHNHDDVECQRIDCQD